MSNEPAASVFPPGPSGLPIVGSMPVAILGGLAFRECMANEYGDVVHWEDPHGHVYQLNDPEDIEHVLVHNNTNYVKLEAKLLAELDSVLDGERPTMADLPELTHTEQVVKESMRLFPPVPGLIHEAKEADEVGGYSIPAGARVFMNQWVIHRDSRWYDDPLAFKPDRWTRGFERSLPNVAYFPFAAGPRRCIGDRFAMLEARLLLATIYQDYHLELASARNLEVIQTITSHPKVELSMVVHDRSMTDTSGTGE